MRFAVPGAIVFSVVLLLVAALYAASSRFPTSIRVAAVVSTLLAVAGSWFIVRINAKLLDEEDAVRGSGS